MPGISSLLRASREGDLKRIKKQLAHGVDVNSRNEENGYALFEALFHDRLEAVKMLLDAGANPNNVELLALALLKGSREMVEMLLEAEADANMSMDGETPLYGAVRFGHLEIVELLLDHGADIDAKLSEQTYGNALSAAMDPEKIQIARLLLKRGADVNAGGGCYGNVLQTATYLNNIEIVRTLLSDKRVDVNAKAGPKGNALTVAYKQQNYKVAKILLNYGAKSMSLEESSNEKTSDRETSEDSSRENTSEEESSDETKSDKKFLIEDTGDEESLHEEFIEEVAIKAKKGDKDTSGEDTMKLVVSEEYYNMYSKEKKENVPAEEVLNKEIDISTSLENSNDKTPLMWACEHHNLDKVRRLLRNRADDTIQTTLGETALILAIPKIPQILNEKIKKILKLLCQNPMNWSHQYRDRNALAYAIHESDKDVIKYLLTLNPPRWAQQEALVHAFFYRVHSMDPLLNFDKTLARNTPLGFFEKIRRQAEESGWTKNKEQYDRACRLFLSMLTLRRQPKKMTQDLTEVCVWSLYGHLEPTICVSGRDLPVDF